MYNPILEKYFGEEISKKCKGIYVVQFCNGSINNPCHSFLFSLGETDSFKDKEKVKEELELSKKTLEALIPSIRNLRYHLKDWEKVEEEIEIFPRESTALIVYRAEEEKVDSLAVPIIAVYSTVQKFVRDKDCEHKRLKRISEEGIELIAEVENYTKKIRELTRALGAKK